MEGPQESKADSLVRFVGPVNPPPPTCPTPKPLYESKTGPSGDSSFGAYY